MNGPFWYRAHGLLFRSDIEIPELTEAEAGTADVAIRLGDEAAAAFRSATALSDPETGLYDTPHGPLVHNRGTADFLIAGRDEIVITFCPGADPDFARLFLIGSVMGMLFHLRGQIVLHGATILADGGASVFVGHSGAGKSTIAAHLAMAGHAVLSDDTLALYPDGDGFAAWPGARVFKLWRDTLARMGRTARPEDQVGRRLDKFFFDNVSPAPDRPVPVREIILLERGADGPALTPLGGLDALQAVNEHSYRPQYVQVLGRETPHFELTARLATAVQAWRLVRPWDLDRMDETLALLGRHWASAGAGSRACPRAAGDSE